MPETETKPRDGAEHQSNIFKKAQERRGQPTDETPQPEPQETPVEQVSDQVDQPPVEDVESTAEPVDTTEESNTEETPPVNEPENELIDLDDDEPTDNPPSEWISDLSNATDYQFNSQDEVIQQFNTLKEENLELKAKLEQPQDSNIPDPLKKAIELAQKGGDYYEYLGVAAIDYSKIDAADLYSNFVAAQNPTATPEQVRDYLDSMPEIEFNFKANEYKSQLVSQQVQRKAQLEAEADQKKQANVARLDDALNNFDNVVGFKVKDADKKAIRESVVNGDIIKELLYDKNGNIDYKAVAEFKTFKDKKDKIEKFIRTSERNQTKRQMVDQIANKNLETTPQGGKIPVKKEEETGARKTYQEIMKGQRERGRLS